MKSDAKPLCKPGERKVLCPYYDGCLDYAVQQGWQFWNCTVCLHRSKKYGSNELPLIKDSDPEYAVVLDAARQLVAC